MFATGWAAGVVPPVAEGVDLAGELRRLGADAFAASRFPRAARLQGARRLRGVDQRAITQACFAVAWRRDLRAAMEQLEREEVAVRTGSADAGAAREAARQLSERAEAAVSAAAADFVTEHEAAGEASAADRRLLEVQAGDVVRVAGRKDRFGVVLEVFEALGATGEDAASRARAVLASGPPLPPSALLQRSLRPGERAPGTAAADDIDALVGPTGRLDPGSGRAEVYVAPQLAAASESQLKRAFVPAVQVPRRLSQLRPVLSVAAGRSALSQGSAQLRRLLEGERASAGTIRGWLGEGAAQRGGALDTMTADATAAQVAALEAVEAARQARVALLAVDAPRAEERAAASSGREAAPVTPQSRSRRNRKRQEEAVALPSPPMTRGRAKRPRRPASPP